MQNNFSKLILSILTNEVLHASYIELVIFLYILFKYYYLIFFLQGLYFFLKENARGSPHSVFLGSPRLT